MLTLSTRMIFLNTLSDNDFYECQLCAHPAFQPHDHCKRTTMLNKKDNSGKRLIIVKVFQVSMLIQKLNCVPNIIRDGK